MLNTLVSLGYSLINAHLCHITPNHKHCYIFSILIFIPQASVFQKEATRWIKILVNSSLSCKPQSNPKIKRWKPTSNTLTRKLWISQNNSNKLLHHPSHQPWMILTLSNIWQPINIHQNLRTLPQLSWVTGDIHRWMVGSMKNWWHVDSETWDHLKTLYGLLIKTWIIGDTSMDLKNFYNHIKMCLDAVDRRREGLLPDYQYIKQNS